MRMWRGSDEGIVAVGGWTWTGADGGRVKGSVRPRRRKTAWAAVRAQREIVAACSRGMVSGTSQRRSGGHVRYSAKAPGLSLRLQAPCRKPATLCPGWKGDAGGASWMVPAKSLPTILPVFPRGL